MKTKDFQLNIFAQTFSIFLVSFLLAYFITYETANAVIATTPLTTGPTNNNPLSFIITFFIASAIAFLLVKYLNSQNFWRVFFGFGAFAGTFVTIFYTVAHLFALRASYFIALPLAIGLIILRQKIKKVWLHNLIVVLAVVGVARLFGFQFTPKGTAIIMAVLALYDVVAVYFSKHMVTMAKKLFERQAFFGIIIPYKLEGWKNSLDDIQVGEKISVLGAGDIAFPLFFALSHMFYNGTLAFWIITLFVMLGVVLMHTIYISPEKKHAIPALPPLVLLAFIGHFVASIFI